MTVIVKEKKTGKRFELLDVTPDKQAFVAPVGHPELGVLRPHHEFEPDPWEIIFQGVRPRWLGNG